MSSLGLCAGRSRRWSRQMNDSLDVRVMRRTLDQHAIAIERLREEIRQVRMVLVAHATHKGQKRVSKGRCTYCGSKLRERAGGE